ncbi:sterol desaturase family protein [bacterium]|nr:sterol desaturase family protein [bacterium]
MDSNMDSYNLLFYSLLISEIPVLFFTILDLCKFESIKKYRISYNNSNNKIIQRPYPTDQELYIGFIEYLKITFGILIPISLCGVTFIKYINFDFLDRSLNLSYIIGFLQLIELFIYSDILFYGIHRIFHTPLLYHIHKKHHIYQTNSFSLINHCLEPLELIIFMIPPILPAIILNLHISIMCMYILLANFIGTYIHSGYSFSYINCALLIDSKHHDIHHVKKIKNYGFGFLYSFSDKLFGTFLDYVDVRVV